MHKLLVFVNWFCTSIHKGSKVRALTLVALYIKKYICKSKKKARDRLRETNLDIKKYHLSNRKLRGLKGIHYAFVGSVKYWIVVCYITNDLCVCKTNILWTMVDNTKVPCHALHKKLNYRRIFLPLRFHFICSFILRSSKRQRRIRSQMISRKRLKTNPSTITFVR